MTRLARPRGFLAGIVAAVLLAIPAAAEAAIIAKPNGPLPSARIAYVPFQASPFPYRGIIPDKQIPFLDAMLGTERGHTAPRAEAVYWESQTYSDRRSLIYFPAGFDIRQPAVIVVFFHGNQVVLQRDVAGRQHVPAQVAESGLNAVLLAPQFAVDALDSSAGTFWSSGAFSRYLDEAASNLASVYGDTSTRTTFARMPVVMVAFSGGYDPAAYALKYGGAAKRVKGVVLLDAPYAYEDMFADFVAQNRGAFFFSAYTASAAGNNAAIKASLSARRIPFALSPPEQFAPGTVAFVAASPDLRHGDFVTNGWVPDPVAWALARIPGYPR